MVSFTPAARMVSSHAATSGGSSWLPWAVSVLSTSRMSARSPRAPKNSGVMQVMRSKTIVGVNRGIFGSSLYQLCSVRTCMSGGHGSRRAAISPALFWCKKSGP